jgi:hypothetical protein
MHMHAFINVGTSVHTNAAMAKLTPRSLRQAAD